MTMPPIPARSRSDSIEYVANYSRLFYIFMRTALAGDRCTYAQWSIMTCQLEEDGLS